MWYCVRWVTSVAMFVGMCSVVTTAWAVDPNPLQNAYWRFEEGTSGGVVNPPNAEAVQDSSGNDNDMRAFNGPGGNASPTYADFIPPKPLKSSLSNSLAFDFNPNPNGKDIYTDTRQINDGIVAPGGGFTIEAAFYSRQPAQHGTIIAKEGRPATGNPDADLDSLTTFSLMTNPDSHLMVQQFDGAGNLVDVQSLLPLNANQWYYAAVVNDGDELSLWLDSGSGYELQNSIEVSGALYQGPDYNGDLQMDAADYVDWRKSNSEDSTRYDAWHANFAEEASWNYNWSIGRGVYGGIPSGSPARWFDGFIDEVRLSNVPLSPSDFLFAAPESELTANAAPEPASMVIVTLVFAIAGIARRRPRPL